jgi:phage terminase large subunit-like protein
VSAVVNLHPNEQRRFYALIQEQKRRDAQTLWLKHYRDLYPWQREFIANTNGYHECCLMAANQIGKSLTARIVNTAHALGDYPEDWPGHKFDFAPMIWIMSYSMEKSRDLFQKQLFGDLRGGEFSGGLIPKERILDYQSAPGTPNAVRTVRIKHRLGTSVVQFWSYTQGDHAIMGDVVDWASVDEEPEDQTIRPQLLTRTINGDSGKGGRIIYTFTPENGRTDLVIKFTDNPAKSQYLMQKGWDDAPHMTEEKKARLLEQYPEHQKDMRSKGSPMLGHGRIYDIAEEYILCDPLQSIPDHYFVIHGMDFGWDHPQAFCQLIEDRDNNVFYISKAWKASKASASDAYGVVKDWGIRIPVAWPQDGLQNEKGRDDATQQKEHYARAGFQMVYEPASWPPITDSNGNQKSGGDSVEQGIYEILQLMRLGKFKFYRGINDLMEEYRQYHRDEKGKIVKIRDDILSAIRYAYMMRRYAVRAGELKEGTKPVYIPRPIRMIGK